MCEIKIAGTAAEAARQATRQLLEYGLRAVGLVAVELFIAGEPAADVVTRRSPPRFRDDFSFDIDQSQVEMPDHIEFS